MSRGHTTETLNVRMLPRRRDAREASAMKCICHFFVAFDSFFIFFFFVVFFFSLLSLRMPYISLFIYLLGFYVHLQRKFDGISKGKPNFVSMIKGMHTMHSRANAEYDLGGGGRTGWCARAKLGLEVGARGQVRQKWMRRQSLRSVSTKWRINARDALPNGKLTLKYAYLLCELYSANIQRRLSPKRPNLNAFFLSLVLVGTDECAVRAFDARRMWAHVRVCVCDGRRHVWITKTELK